MLDLAPVALPAGVTLRLLHPDDGPALAAAYTRDRSRLEPWEPERPESYFTPEHHTRAVADELTAHRSALSVPCVLTRDGEIVGRVTLSDVVAGPFRSANLGYWLAGAVTGHGVMTAAVEAVVTHARDVLGLHRLQAATLPHNEASQGVLARTGFEKIGYAPRYLQIAGAWQDHVLFQRILHD